MDDRSSQVKKILERAGKQTPRSALFSLVLYLLAGLGVVSILENFYVIEKIIEYRRAEEPIGSKQRVILQSLTYRAASHVSTNPSQKVLTEIARVQGELTEYLQVDAIESIRNGDYADAEIWLIAIGEHEVLRDVVASLNSKPR